MAQLTINFNSGFADFAELRGQITVDGLQNHVPEPRQEPFALITLPRLLKITQTVVHYYIEDDETAAVGLTYWDDGHQHRITPEGTGENPPDLGDHTFTYSVAHSTPVYQIELGLGGSPARYGALIIRSCVITYDAEASCPHENGDCDAGIHGENEPAGSNPIGLRTGEKREQATDLVVNSPAGALAFTRAYRQSKLNDSYFPQVMGLGWSHNHNYFLDATSTADMIFVYLAEGGRGHFQKDSATRYIAKAGGTSLIEINNGSTDERYTLKTDNHSFVFNDQGKLRFRRWANGEEWTYTYYTTPHVAAGKLKEVGDGYGRKLQFAYLDNSGQFNHLQLRRLGDQTASGLETVSPSGRYLEYSYIEEYQNGAVKTPTPKPLLRTVTDVRGQVWTYQYYGYVSGENDSNQYNYLTQYQSPQVDTDGNSSSDAVITRKKLQYTPSAGGGASAITQELGIRASDPALLTTDYAFLPGGAEYSTEVTGGKTTTHLFANGVYFGPQDPAGNHTYRFVDSQHRPVELQDGNRNITRLNWSGDGKRLEKVTDAKLKETSFAYNSENTLHSSLDASGRKTLYFYEDGTIVRQPTLILVTDGSNQAVNGDMELDSNWASVGAPALNKRTPHADSGQYMRRVTTSAASQGIEGNSWDLDAGVAYTLSARVFVVSGAVKMQVPGVANFDQTSTGTEAWETFSKTYTPGSSVTGKKLQFVASGGAAEFYVDSVSIRRAGIDLAVNGDMELDSNWTAVGSPSTNERAVGADTGQYARRVAGSASQGIEGSSLSLVQNRAYVLVARVYAVSGTVRMKISGTTAFDKTTTATGKWQTLRASYTPTSALNNVKVQFLADGGAADFYVDSVYLLDSTQALGWQEFVYDSHGRVLTEKTFDPADPTGTPAQQVTRTYYTSGNGSGLLESVTQHDLPSGVNNSSTTYTYDSAGRVIKTQKSSLFGSCEFTFTVYDAAGNVVRSLCSTQNLVSPETATTDADTKVTVYEYDTLGRRIKTIANYVNGVYSAATPQEDQTTLIVYDALDRVVRTIVNYVPVAGISTPYTAAHSAFAAHHGSDNTENLVTDTVYDARGLVSQQIDVLGNVTCSIYDDAGRLVRTLVNYVAQGGSDPTTWVWDALDGRWEYGSGSPVDHGANNDQNLITEQGYDHVGNLVKTVDALRNVSYTAFDELNRPVKTVRNAKDTATILLVAGQSGYDATNDPRSSSYVPSTAADRDLIEITEYDALGRVIRTRRLLDNSSTALWEVNLNGYDTAGRLVRSIRNASTPEYDLNADPDLSGYSLSSAADKDILTTTVYDTDGRVQYTEDVLNRKARQVYDGLGRTFRSISNYLPQGTPETDPGTWVWDSATDNRWEQAAGTAVGLGTGYDQNQISHTEYDADGHVRWTQDVQGRKTWHVYDTHGRRIKTIVNCTYNGTGTAPESPSYTGSSDPDKDVITRTEYNTWGQVWKTFDAAGIETRSEYDALGRQTRTTTNYVDGVFSGAVPDEDLIQTTTYDAAGRVLTSTDARGTVTRFEYDALGRRLKVTLADGTSLASTHFTCYDLSGRVLRTLQNWFDNGTSPNAKDSSGSWLFNPGSNGAHADQNLITRYSYDAAGRVLSVSDPLGSVSSSAYYKDGQVQSQTDPMGVVTAFRYDGLRRRVLVVQSFVDNGEDPALWLWDATDARWEKSGGAAISFGANNDENIIVSAAYDKAGRMTSLRGPLGKLTTYAYDLLDRRTSKTNPLSKTWATAYALITSGASGGTSRATLTDPNGVNTQRDTDLAGRLASIQYGLPGSTPDVKFTYDKRGSRTLMSEYSGAGFTSKNRETSYSYDDVRRLTSVGFDNDGSGSVDQTVSYQYDAGGSRTRLTLPGSLNVNYSYDARGQLISLQDWDSQTTSFGYDGLGRHVLTQRPNGLTSTYQRDQAGRLRLLRHHDGSKALAQFVYDLDARGNRIQAQELVVQSGATPANITYLCTDNKVAYRGTWNAVVSGFKPTSDVNASLKLALYCTGLTFTYGRGPDHGIFDVYIGGSLYASYDGYNATQDEVSVTVNFGSTKAYTFEIRNRRDKRSTSSGNVVRFKKVDAVSVLTADLHTIRYGYDKLARLRSADYADNDSPAATPFRQYAYAFDVAGNRTQQVATVGGTPTTTDYEYNAGNQLYRQRVNAGAWTNLSYDNNGSLTSDGTNSYTWDRANRLLSMGGSSYAYDGLGNRHKQTISGTATNYLLDLQPGLTVVLAQTTGANTDRFLHALEGIHAQKDAANNWEYLEQDGLGSVRGVVSSSLSILETRLGDPFGNAISSTGSSQTSFGFTGEMSDPNELLFLRARYYRPSIGTFTTLDPFEGMPCEPMSLNGYGYVHENPINWSDPTGNCPACIIFVLEAIALAVAAVAVATVAYAIYNLWNTIAQTINGGLCLEAPARTNEEEEVDDEDLPNPFKGCGVTLPKEEPVKSRVFQ